MIKRNSGNDFHYHILEYLLALSKLNTYKREKDYLKMLIKYGRKIIDTLDQSSIMYHEVGSQAESHFLSTQHHVFHFNLE